MIIPYWVENLRVLLLGGLVARDVALAIGRKPITKRTEEILSLLTEEISDAAQELQGTIGFGDVVIAAGGSGLLFVAFHGE